jgi:predicted Zn-dependent protease with MMP-like domain
MIHLPPREFDKVVERALAEIPDEFQSYLDNVVVEVHRRPSAALCREHDVPDDILGLYIGSPIDEKGAAGELSFLPDRVLIFSDNLCDMCETVDELVEEIRITVLHEIGHHFGLDEDRLEELGYD